MLSRRQIQYIKSLQQKKFRKEYNCFVAEGSKIVEELLASNLEPHSIFATPAWAETHQHLLAPYKALISIVNVNELQRISSLKTPATVLAVFKTRHHTFDPKHLESDFVLMLDGIGDPGNLGTIIRTADWFGIKHVVCSLETVDLYNPKTVQASMGSLARVQVYYKNLYEILVKLPANIQVYGAVLNGKPITGLNLTSNGILLVGNEAHGISNELLTFISEPIIIPSQQKDGAGTQRPESLNAAIATAILCYELRRQSLKR